MLVAHPVGQGKGRTKRPVTIPRADFAVIEGGSHFSMFEDAAKLRDAVVPWLRSHGAIPASRRSATG